MVKGFEGSLEYIQHDYDSFTFIPWGDYLIVEGTSQGRMSGKSWAGGKTPGGRFCNVFRFRDGRISSMHVYLDPDYTGEDEARFRWGKNRHWLNPLCPSIKRLHLATNFCRRGDEVSFFQIRLHGSRTFISTTGTKAMPRGQCQRTVSGCQESPIRHWTR